MRFILIALFLIGCETSSKPSKTPLEEVQAKRDTYIDLIEDPYDLVNRCDGLTFIGLWDEAVQEERRVDIYRHEDKDGGWHRDVLPCYPDDSRSEISAENIMGALRSLVVRQDYEGAERMYNYGNDRDWIMGEGPEEYTDLWFLEGIISDFLVMERSAFELGIRDKLKGYRGNVLADYIQLHGIINTYIEGWHKLMLEQLVKTTPQNPIYQALYHCYTDGDQTIAVGILNNQETFPPDRLPETPLALFDWSDAPASILYIWVVKILESC